MPEITSSSPSSAAATSGAHRRGVGVRARWLGLQDKLLVSNMLLITAILACCGIAFSLYSSQLIRSLKRQEIRHIAAAAAVAATVPLEDEDAGSLAEVARRLLESAEASNVTYYDEHGVPLAGWRQSENGPVRIIASQVPSTVLSESGRIQALPGGQGVRLLVPVLPPQRDSSFRAPLGYVAVTGSDIPTAQHSREVARLVFGGSLALLAVALPIVFLLAHRAFSPIRRMAVAARNVAAGRFETVDIVRADALGVLADAFNDMVVRLGEQKVRADEAHARLLEANLHLEQKIAERTAAIKTASQRLASEIAEKEDFLRAISHDLNAPLRNIDGMVSMLLRKHAEELPEEVVARLERVKKNVEHETSLISELLELSRIKTRREQPEPVNLEEMMWELRGLFENDLREHDIDLIIETQLPTLHAERARIRQVFQNLIDNAVKYMGDNPVRQITVGARLASSETEFWVRDTGQGIAPEDLGKIFYVFRRGRNQQNVAGKGVGLASVKSILENYNGRIWVESAPGEGSTFRFTINGRFVAEGTARPEAQADRARDAQAATSHSATRAA